MGEGVYAAKIVRKYKKNFGRDYGNIPDGISIWVWASSIWYRGGCGKTVGVYRTVRAWEKISSGRKV